MVSEGRWKAADQGNATAQAMLGAMYFSGQGVPQDNTEAVKWLRKANSMKSLAETRPKGLHAPRLKK